MTRQKSLKREVRGRMQKTGERYTAARRQVLARADDEATVEQAIEREPALDAEREPALDAESEPALDAAPVGRTEQTAEPPVSEEAITRATGRGWNDWFSTLDEWGATDHTHTQIARHVREELGVDGWWAQAVTIGYERARGMRGKHEMGTGYTVGANRTIGVPADRLVEAFTDPTLLGKWLPGVALSRRPSRAERTLRFDWPEDRSRVVVFLTAKRDGKSVASVQHERLPDADAAERRKAFWRDRLMALKRLLESPTG